VPANIIAVLATAMSDIITDLLRLSDDPNADPKTGRRTVPRFDHPSDDDHLRHDRKDRAGRQCDIFGNRAEDCRYAVWWQIDRIAASAQRKPESVASYK